MSDHPFARLNRAIRRPSLGLMAMVLLSSPGISATICFIPHDSSDGRRDWAFDVGVAFITTNNIGDFALGRVNIADGPSGGEIYSFTASRRLGELKWEIGGHTFRPQLEMPLTLEVVDENSRSPFLDLNATVMIRWVDFPWNDYVKTSFAMGLGLSYSSKIYLMDIERHPDSNRSHLKFNWPIQLTLALPAHPDHQFMLFVAHQSGGHIFDDGGVNSIGLGYRRAF